MSIPPTELERLHRRVQELVPRTLAFKPCYYWDILHCRAKGGSSEWWGPKILNGWTWTSTTGGDYVEFDFYGPILGVSFGSLHPDHGIAYVYIDGKKVAEIDLYKSLPEQCNPFFLITTELELGKHTVRIECSGLKNPSAAGYKVPVQGIYTDPKYNPDFTLGFRRCCESVTEVRLYYIAEEGFHSLETTTPLGANAEYVGQSHDRSLRTQAWFHAMAFADVDGTIYIDQSHDGTNWDYSESASLTGGAGAKQSSRVVAGYIRIRYVNGVAAQTVFRFGRRVTFA